MKLNTPAGALIASLFVFPALCAAQDTPQQPGPAGGDVPAAKAKKNDIFLPMPEPVLESFRKPGISIDPKFWQLTEAADAEMVKAKNAKIPRHIDLVKKIVLTDKPDQPVLIQNSSDFKVLGNGFFLVTGSGGGGVSDSEGTSLSWLGLMMAYSRAHYTRQSIYLIEGTVTTQLADLAKFDIKLGTLAPGATFGWDRTSKQQTYFHVVGPLHTTSGRTSDKDLHTRAECTVGERVPASAIFAEFTGNALQISCASTGVADIVIELYYLEDYAWFLPHGSRDKTGTIETKVTGIVQ